MPDVEGSPAQLVDCFLCSKVCMRSVIIVLQQYLSVLQAESNSLQDDKILLQHNNARPHTALRTQEAIHELGWTTLPHPACSPYLAPSDYHLFGKLKEFLRGNHYGNVEDA